MEWYKDLYIGKSAQKKKDDLIQKIESGKTPVDTYLLTLPSDDKNQLEIIPAWNLKHWYQRKKCPIVVGICCGRYEAIYMVQQIVEEVYEKTGSADIREYFEKQL